MLLQNQESQTDLKARWVRSDLYQTDLKVQLDQLLLQHQMDLKVQLDQLIL